MTLAGGVAQGAVKLPAFFTDNMIVQRNAVLTVPGTASPRSQVTARVEWAEKPFATVADAQGRFSLSIPTPEAGGPYCLEVTEKTDGSAITINNILVGEVWLCSGQSNMEYPVKGWTEIMDFDRILATSQNPEIRVLQVHKNVAHSPQADIEVNRNGWQEASPWSVADFSAIAYLFAKRLHSELNVPVGVIDATWGGTPAEAWTPFEDLKTVEGFEDEVAMLERNNFNTQAMKADYEKRLDAWMALASTNGGGEFDKARMQTGAQWRRVKPVYFEQSGFGSGFDGVVWVQYALNLPKEAAGKDVTLHLGALDDEDVTYFNGKEVARGSGYNVPRVYTVPGALVKGGENVITIRITDFGGEGGFAGGADALYADVAGSRVPLTSEWNAFAAVDFSTLPKKPTSVEGSSYPTVLYNAMLAPLKALPLKGFLWYQGCANVGRDAQYAKLFPTMIESWRKIWGKDTPFYFVQLAGYLAPNPLQPESEWAALRNAQAAALKLPNTGMAVAIDLGHPTDIHPRNKQDVADRLARLALARDYGKNIAFRAPTVKEVKAVGGKLRLTFDGPVTTATPAVTGFMVGDGKGTFAVASAKQTAPNVVELSSMKIASPKVARYNWADYPGGNLRSEAGLPVAPFATDK